MLAYKNRFHGHGSLRFVYKNGRAVRGRLLTIKTSINPRRTTPRVAVVISKKILKSAVGRNRVRRRIYEITRQLLPNISPAGADIVFIITSAEARDVAPQELTQRIGELLLEAGIYKNTP